MAEATVNSANSNCFRFGRNGSSGSSRPRHQCAQLAVENRARLLPQVGNFQDVAQDVVAVVAQQRIGVEHQRAHRADEHHVQADVIQQPRLAEPPDERGDRGQHQLDVHAGRADRRPMPAVGQHPRIGDVAIQAGREHQHHHAHLVAFAAEMFARQAVAELVQHLGDRQRGAEPNPVLGARRTCETTAAASETCRTARAPASAPTARTSRQQIIAGTLKNQRT